MGRRKKAAKVVKKKVVHAVATVFKCLFCNHEASVQCKLNLNSMIGDLVCRICDAKFETQINTLTGACQDTGCLSVCLFVCLPVLLRPAVHLSLNLHVLLSPCCPSICRASLRTNPFPRQTLSLPAHSHPPPAARRTPQTQSTSSPSGWTRPTSYRKRSSGARCRACRGGSRASWATARTTLMPAQT